MASSALTCIAAREGRVNGPPPRPVLGQPSGRASGFAAWCAAALGGPPPGPDRRLESLVGGHKGPLRGL